jgi:hypothetical protein
MEKHWYVERIKLKDSPWSGTKGQGFRATRDASKLDPLHPEKICGYKVLSEAVLEFH